MKNATEIKRISEHKRKSYKIKIIILSLALILIIGIVGSLGTAVPTPVNEDHTPNLSYIKSAAEAISHELKKGQLIIIESTIYPGTSEEVILSILEKSGLKDGKKKTN